MRSLLPAFVFVAGLVFAFPVIAQDGERENITIGLSSETVQIATNFTGTDLTIFGSVNNVKADSLATGVDAPKLTRWSLARDLVRYAGEWVVAVVAESRALAEDAAAHARPANAQVFA